jgi:regulator of protease activity HflC (stomatin/prohibitin superfamily)
MASVFEKLFEFIKQFWPLFLVLPWESAVRSRGGRHVALLAPGVHVRIPFFDNVALVNTRTRFVHTDPQTVTTKDGAPLTVGLVVGFCISDPLTAVLRLHEPERSVTAMAAGFLADYVSASMRADASPRAAAAYVLEELRASAVGYEFETCQACEFGYLKTFRMLQQYGSANWTKIEERTI